MRVCTQCEGGFPHLARRPRLQLLRFELYDWDVKVAAVSEQDFLGSVQCSVGEVVAAGRKVGRTGTAVCRGRGW